MRFEEELDSVLPPDLPRRAAVIALSARHLELIEQANAQFNLTRITGAREAAIKHVLDSVLPWREFAGATRVLDAGTGAGFPGIPLAIALPETHFTLTDSVGKKARFVESSIRALGLLNVTAINARAEEILGTHPAAIITGRALAPLDKACALFGPALRSGSRAILYKGPDVDSEMEAASSEARKQRLQLRVIQRYQLPDNLGTRTLVQMSS